MSYNQQLRGKIVEYFVKRYSLRPAPRGWMRGDCPVCRDKNIFGINTHSLSTNCFKNKCTEGISASKLIMQIEGISTRHELYKLLEAFDGTAYSEVEVDYQPSRKKKPIEFPESYIPLGLSDNSVMARKARKVWKSRGFSIYKATVNGIGFCSSGEYRGYFILPYYVKGELVYFTTRRFLSSFGPKFKNPSIDDFNVGKSQLIYNIDAFHIYQSIDLFESITNANTLGSRGVAFGGKYLSDWQKQFIIESPCERLTISLDRDAYKEAIELALELVFYKKVRIVLFKDSRDANDLGKKAYLELRKKSKWLDFKTLNKMLQDEKSK
jgi:hypothetical protein